MTRSMMRSCYGPDGRPDERRMVAFMERQDRSSLLDAIGWGLFFIWAGLCWLLGIGLGWGLIGVGVLSLSIQAVRALADLGVDGYWLFVGSALILGGFWELWHVEIPLAPLVLIITGIALMVWRVFEKEREPDR